MPLDADNDVRFEVTFTQGISAEEARAMMTDFLCTNPYFKRLRSIIDTQKKESDSKLCTIKSGTKNNDTHENKVIHKKNDTELLKDIESVCNSANINCMDGQTKAMPSNRILIHKISPEVLKRALKHHSFFTNEIKMWKKTFAFCTSSQRLVLSQKLLHSYLDFNLLLECPELINGALKTAFSEYKRLYCAETACAYMIYRNEIQTIQRDAKDLQKKLRALRQLESLPGDAINHSPVLTSRFAHIKALLPERLATEVELMHRINVNADTSVFHIGKKSTTRFVFHIAKRHPSSA